MGETPILGADRWDDVAEVFAAELRRYYARHGLDAGAPSSVSTIRTNTDLVPGRADRIIGWLCEGLAVESLQGLRVLEMGCGFGALACYLAWKEQPTTLVAADVNDRFLEVAYRATARVNTGVPVDVVKSDMRDLSQFEAASFDVIILNNAFIYLATREDQLRALRELRRVLAPRGILFLYHANKWQLREPFTRAPLVHLMPGPIAELMERRLGWKTSHGRVRYLSQRELKRQLRATGFKRPGAVAPAAKRRATPFAPFYGVRAYG